MCRQRKCLAIFLIILCTACRHLESPKVKIEPQNNNTTSLKFLNRKVDFSFVKGDTLLVAKYIFVNTGFNNLVIESIKPDCTCTGFYLSNKLVQPNDSGYILLKFSTKGKEETQEVYATIAANTDIRLYSIKLIAHLVNDTSKIKN